VDAENLIEVATPLGFTVRCTRRYWEFIVTHKHPVLRGRGAAEIAQVLGDPDEMNPLEHPWRSAARACVELRRDGPAPSGWLAAHRLSFRIPNSALRIRMIRSSVRVAGVR